MMFWKKLTGLLLLIGCLANTLSAQEQPQDFRSSGVYFGAYTGTWFGTGNSSKLGNSIMLGLLLEIKSQKSALGLNFDFFGNLGKTTPLYIIDDDKTIEKNCYSNYRKRI